MNIGNIAVAIFLILFGILSLVNTEIPKWVLGLVGLFAGLIVLFVGWRRTP